MAANHQQIKNYQPAYDSLKKIVRSSGFYQNHIARRNIGAVKNLAESLVKSAQLRDFVEGLRQAKTPHSFIPGLDKALTLIHEAVDRIRNSAPHSAYTFKLMSDLPRDGELAPFTIYIAKEGNMLRYRVAHPSRTGAGHIEGQIRVEASIDLPAPLTLESLTEDIRAEILQITFERGATVNDEKHLQRLIDILDCAMDEEKNYSDLFPILGYDSQGRAYDSIPRRDEPVALAAEKEPEVPEEDFSGSKLTPAKLSKVDLDGIEDAAKDGAAEGEMAGAGPLPPAPGPGILQELMSALTKLGSDREILEKRDFQNFNVLTPMLKRFLLNIFERVRQGNIQADRKEDIRLLLEEVHALLRVVPKEGVIPDLNLPSLELSDENIVQVREWLRQHYTVVTPEGDEDFAKDGFVAEDFEDEGGRFILPLPDPLPDPVEVNCGDIAHRAGGDPLSRVMNGTNDPALIVPAVQEAAPPAVATTPHALASTTHIAGTSSLWRGAKKMDGYLRRRRDGYQHVSLPMMRLFATLRKFESDPVLAGAKVSADQTVWESLNPAEPGKFKVSSLVGSQANPQGGILDSAMENHRRYQQQYMVPLAQVGGIYQPPGKIYHFKRTRSDLIQIINAESLTPEELCEATQELIVICQDVFDKIEIDICVYDNPVFEQARGEELLKQVVMTTMSQGVNLLAADKAEEHDKEIQRRACDLKTKMDIPQPEFQDVEAQGEDFRQADTTNWVMPKETALRSKGIRVMTESGRVLPEIDSTVQDRETELRCEYWSTIAKWEKEDDWRSMVGVTDIFLHVLEPLQTAPELYQKDGIYGHLTLLGESELKTFEECVEQQRQELEKWATVRQETLRRQRAQERQSVYRENDEFAGEFPDSNDHRNRARLSDSAEQQSIEQNRDDTTSEEDLSELEDAAQSEVDEEGNGSDDEGEKVPLLHADASSQSRLTHRSLQPKAWTALEDVSESEAPVHEVHARSRRAQHFQNGQALENPQSSGYETVVTLSASVIHEVVERGRIPPAVDDFYEDEEEFGGDGRPLLRPASSSPKARMSREEAEQYAMERGIQESMITASRLPAVSSRKLPGVLDIGDAGDDGNCFYYSLVTQFEILDPDRLDAVPLDKEPHEFFREEVEKSQYEDKRWVEIYRDFQRISEEFNIVIAIINTSAPHNGFRCYYSEDGQLKEAYYPSEMPRDNRLIVRLAFSGDHFMPVLGHPPQLEGALRSAYGTCAAPHRVDSMRDSDSVAFFPPSPKRSIPVSLSVGKPREGINPTARSESPTLG